MVDKFDEEVALNRREKIDAIERARLQKESYEKIVNAFLGESHHAFEGLHNDIVAGNHFNNKIGVVCPPNIQTFMLKHHPYTINLFAGAVSYVSKDNKEFYIDKYTYVKADKGSYFGDLYTKCVIGYVKYNHKNINNNEIFGGHDHILKKYQDRSSKKIVNEFCSNPPDKLQGWTGSYEIDLNKKEIFKFYCWAFDPEQYSSYQPSEDWWKTEIPATETCVTGKHYEHLEL